MIRSILYDFIYPISCPWPASESQIGFYRNLGSWDNEKEKAQWRGLCLLLSTLAQHPHQIKEFVIHVNQLRTGLSCRMFDTTDQN
jgi:hypothetical protein